MPQRLRPHVSFWGRLLVRSKSWSKGRKPRKISVLLFWNFFRPWQKGGRQGRQQPVGLEDNAFLAARSKHFRLCSQTKKSNQFLGKLGTYTQCLRIIKKMSHFSKTFCLAFTKKNQTKLNSLLHLHAMLQMRLLSDFLTLWSVHRRL